MTQINVIPMSSNRFVEINEMAEETIGHWEQVVAGKLYYRTTLDCPACKKYLYQEQSCNGCYIAEKTNKNHCTNTPIQEYIHLHLLYYVYENWDVAIELKAAAQDCLDFLVKLKLTLINERLIELIHENNKPNHKHGSAHEFIKDK